MGRSVDYLSNAANVTYFECNTEEDAFAFNDLESNITFELQNKYPSLTKVKNEWDGCEVRIILENSLCQIGISEYCGLVSISIRVNDSDYPAIAEAWINRVWSNMVKVMKEGTYHNNYTKTGTFSNGEGVYQKN